MTTCRTCTSTLNCLKISKNNPFFGCHAVRRVRYARACRFFLCGRGGKPESAPVEAGGGIFGHARGFAGAAGECRKRAEEAGDGKAVCAAAVPGRGGVLRAEGGAAAMDGGSVRADRVLRFRAWGVSGCGLICSDGEIRSLSAEGGTTGGVPGLSGGQGLGEVGFPGECFV